VQHRICLGHGSTENQQHQYDGRPITQYLAAASEGKCLQRFLSTAIMYPGILLWATWQLGLDSMFDLGVQNGFGKELLDAFDRVVHEDFPNPQRIACPGREVLLKLARQPADTQLAHLLAHIRQCAPCFDELKELRQEGRIQTR
jgi:hypothetical protein